MEVSSSDVFCAKRSELFDRHVILLNEERKITRIPYYARAHRGLSEMSAFLKSF